MPSALHVRGEYVRVEAFPLAADGEEAVTKRLYKQRHHARELCGVLLHFFQPNFWTFVTCVLVIYLFSTLGYGQSQFYGQNTYGNGYETEFSASRQAISIKKIKFTGGLYFDYNGTLHASSNPEEPIYVGPPSKEIDDAWETLIHDRYVAVTPEQAREVGGNIYFMPENGIYRAGMDVLHTLHCLNLLRMTQDFEHYLEKGDIEKGPNRRMHIDHCINHLRQIVQCHGDMTPLPVIWVDIKNHAHGGRTIPDFDQVHTCRDFTALREWSTEQDQIVLQMSGQKLKPSSYGTVQES